MAPSKVLIVGSGVVGLRTALELIRRKACRQIILESPVPPNHFSTCSMGAGGLWMPYHCPDERINQWSLETYNEIIKQQHKEFVEVVPWISLQKSPQTELPSWSNDPRLGARAMTLEELYSTYSSNEQTKTTTSIRLPNQSLLERNGYQYAWLFWAPIMDSPRMLWDMYQKLQNFQNNNNHDDTVVQVNVETQRYFTNLQDMIQHAKSLECDALVNCTGLGAFQICKENNEESSTKMVGARGILMSFPRKNPSSTLFKQEQQHDPCVFIHEPPYGSDTEPAYMVPRGNQFVVGGSFQEGDTRTALSREERERLMRNASLLLNQNIADLDPPVGEWVGFRPCRWPQSRCELDETMSDDQIRVVHSYGFGGSGWTVHVGVANLVADILLS